MQFSLSLTKDELFQAEVMIKDYLPPGMEEMIKSLGSKVSILDEKVSIYVDGEKFKMEEFLLMINLL